MSYRKDIKQPKVSDQLFADQDLNDPEVKEKLVQKNGVGDFQVLQAHKPTQENREAVMAMRLAEIPKKRIAKVLEISESTLNKYYQREFDLALDQIDNLVMSQLLQGIKQGDPKLIQFYLKNKKNWNDKQEHIVTHKVSKTKEEIEQELRELGVPEDKLKDI